MVVALRLSGLRVWTLVVVVGVCVALVSGLVENRSGIIGIPEKRYYGYPFVWRTTDPFMGSGYRFLELAVDCVVWIVAITFVILLSKPLMRGTGKEAQVTKRE